MKIDWQQNPRIGADFEQSVRFRPEQDRRAFYDDRFKLLALFPVNSQHPQIFKDAPFDVTVSGLANTFFDSWSGIKNNVILHWVDLYDDASQIGLALMTDHTTSYAHGDDCPLGLTLQYAGIGLWGRDYTVKGSTEVNYSLLPHRGNYEQSNLWAAGDSWNEPLLTRAFDGDPKTAPTGFSLLTIDGPGWETPTLRCQSGRVLVRCFNASADETPRALHYRGPASKVELVQLNGNPVREISFRRNGSAGIAFELALPKFGIGTLRITP